jgi:hypothetical protein
MVEYAILVAGTSLRALSADVSDFADRVNWTAVGYAALALVALRVAAWAFRPTR